MRVNPCATQITYTCKGVSEALAMMQCDASVYVLRRGKVNPGTFCAKFSHIGCYRRSRGFFVGFTGEMFYPFSQYSAYLVAHDDDKNARIAHYISKVAKSTKQQRREALLRFQADYGTYVCAILRQDITQRATERRMQDAKRTELYFILHPPEELHDPVRDAEDLNASGSYAIPLASSPE